MSTSHFSDLATLVATSDLKDARTTDAVREQILETRRALSEAPTELVACLDAAATLVRSLPHLEHGSAAEVKSMVGRLIDLVSTASDSYLPASTPGVSAPRPAEPVQVATEEPEPVSEAEVPLFDEEEAVAPESIAFEEPLDILSDASPQAEPLAPDLSSPDVFEEPAADVFEAPPVDLYEAPTCMPAELEAAVPDDPPAAARPSFEDAYPSMAPPVPFAQEPVDIGQDLSVPKLNDMLLGEVMIQLGFVTPVQVDQALKMMASSGRRFGEALIEIGAATAADVEQGINLQRVLSSKNSDEPERREEARDERFGRASVLHGILLGEILVRMKRITREGLQQGLQHQAQCGSRIGEALVDLGLISWKDLDEAIRMQHARGGSSELNESSTIVRLEGGE